MSTQSVSVFYESTPNPQSMKFICTSPIAEENIYFQEPQGAERSPLAMKIFGFPWCEAVFIGTNFVTITKQDWVDWEIIADLLSDLIAEHLNSDEPVLLPAESLAPTDDDEPVVKRIKEILNQEIRPAVAMDGGDIIFHKYEDQKVFLFMQGACSGCPSSSITLKMGIETRLKEAVPEIDEVIAM